MVGQHGVDLAVSLITSHFCDLVPKVCGCQRCRGTLSLQEIVRSTELLNSQVKNSLNVLIQHNYVQAISVPRATKTGVAAKTVTQYMALFDNILHRLRFPKFWPSLGKISDSREQTTIEQQAMFAAALSDAKRFSAVLATGTEGLEVHNEDKLGVSVGDNVGLFSKLT